MNICVKIYDMVGKNNHGHIECEEEGIYHDSYSVKKG